MVCNHDFQENLIIEGENGERVKRSCTTSKKFYNLDELFSLEDKLMKTKSTEDKLVNLFQTVQAFF